jgi:dihydroxy-acid dehydratase
MSSALVFALDGAGLIDEVAFVTDGQLSGLVNRGLVVGEVSPEAAEGGPLALVENGDRITIDIEKRAVDLEVPARELGVRRAAEPRIGRSDEIGYLSQYRRAVQPLPKGAVLK